MDVSIVIVNWNTKELLAECLRSIYEHTKKLKFEIIVVDNASSDGSADLVKKLFPKVIVIQNDKNVGYATGNNQGLAVAKGKYALVLNSDTYFFDNTIAKVYEFAEKNNDAAVVGCKISNKDMTLQGSAFMFPSLNNLFLWVSYLSKIFPTHRFFGRERMGWWDWDSVHEAEVIVGCFMMVRMSAIKEVGPMDTAYFMYCEETDWCYRFKKAGWKILYAPISGLVHLGGESTKKKKGEMFLQMNSSILLYFHKHKGKVSYVFACILVMLYFFIRIPYWLGHALVSRSTRKTDYDTARVYIKGFLCSFWGWRGLLIQKK